MKNKLKLVLWGKNLELPMNYDKLKFDDYIFGKDDDEYYDLYIYKNNKMIKRIWYWQNGNKGCEWNYKNGKRNGKQYGWWCNGDLDYDENWKNGKEIND